MRKKYVATIGIIIFMLFGSSIRLISNNSTGTSNISTRTSNISIGVSIPKISTNNLNNSNSTDDWSMFGGNLQHTNVISQVTSNSSEFCPIWSSNITFDEISINPSAANGYVYCSSNASFYCFNAYQGNLTWSYFAGAHIDTTSAIENGSVYFGTYNGEIYCLNAINGDFIWKYNISSICSSPLVFNGRLYMGSYSEKDFYCLNANNGNLEWDQQMDGVTQSSPSEYAGNIYLGTNNGSMYCLNSTDGNIIWRYQTGSLIQVSPTEYNGNVYFGNENNTEYCLNALTGKIIWSRSLPSLRFSMSQCLSNGKLYIASSSIYCLEANTGQKLWERSFDYGIYATPLISNGILYAPGLYTFYFIDPLTGNDIWNSNYMDFDYARGYYFSGGICASFGFLYYITDGNLECLPMNLAPTQPNNLQFEYSYPYNAYQTTEYKGENYSVCSLQMNYIYLTWDPPYNDGSSPITGYKIYRSDSSHAMVCIATIGNVTKYNDTGLLYGHSYYYKVSAINKNGESIKSYGTSRKTPDPPISQMPRFHFNIIELVIIFLPSIALIIYTIKKSKIKKKRKPSSSKFNRNLSNNFYSD